MPVHGQINTHIPQELLDQIEEVRIRLNHFRTRDLTRGQVMIELLRVGLLHMKVEDVDPNWRPRARKVDTTPRALEPPRTSVPGVYPRRA